MGGRIPFLICVLPLMGTGTAPVGQSCESSVHVIFPGCLVFIIVYNY